MDKWTLEQIAKEKKAANRILNESVKLGLALQEIPLEDIIPNEQKLVKAQLTWLLEEITKYLT